MSMIKLGNIKLGRGIWTFSLPAGSTCPGKTKLCASLCYAKKGYYVFGNVKESNLSNLRESRRADFVASVSYELRQIRPRVVRWHAAGDFYSVEYTRKVMQIVKNHPDITFYMYTRSWRDKDIARVLKQMCLLENCVMWLSTDRDSPKAPSWPRIAGVAFLSQNVHDQPGKADLVFIDSVVGQSIKFLNGTLVCPYEQNVKRKHPLTCSTCGFCLERQKGRQFTAASSSLNVIPKRLPLKMVG